MSFDESICDKCPVQTYKKMRVWGGGSLNAEILIVSDYPWHSEMGSKRPWTGPSGKLARKVIEKYNTLNLPLYITNVCKCPNQDPKKPVLDVCFEHLKVEFESLPLVKTIGIFGGKAYEIILPDRKKVSSLTADVGKRFLSPVFNKEAVVNINPAAVMRQERNFPLFNAGVKSLFRIPPVLKLPPIRVTTEISDLENWAGQHVALDIETNSSLDYVSSESRIESINFCNGIESLSFNPPTISEPRFWNAVRELYLITHNGSFDLKFCLAKYNQGFTIAHDTMIMAYAANESFGAGAESGYSLERLACLHLGVKPWKHLGYTDLEYMNKDVYYTYKLWEYFFPDLFPVKNVYTELMMPLFNEKSYWELEGITFDHEKCKDLETEWAGMIKHFRDQMNKEVRKLSPWSVAVTANVITHPIYQAITSLTRLVIPLTSFTFVPNYNPRSDKQNKFVFNKLFKQLGFTYKLKDTTKETLEEIIKSNNELIEESPNGGEWACSIPFFEAYFNFTELSHSHDTFLTDKWVREDGKVHSDIKIHGTRTGRPSSSEPNIFNVPKPLRGIYIPDKGHVLIKADYSQLEMKVLIILANHEEMMSLLRQGHDFHSATARILMKYRNIAGEVTSDIRRKAKNVNFGISYGAGPDKIAHYLGCSRDEAREFIRAYSGPLDDWKSKTIDQALSDRYVKTLYGSYRRIHVITRQNINKLKREIINNLIQGTAVQMAEERAVEISKTLRTKFDSRILLHLYDEVVITAPKEVSPVVAGYIKGVMERPFWFSDIVFTVDVKTSERWS